MFTETGRRTAQPGSSSFSLLPSLFKRFFDQFLKLLDTQLALFKAELKGAVRVYARHLVLATSSVLVALVGFSFLSFGLVFWINGNINSLAVSFGYVGGAYLIIGIVSALAAVRRITHQPPVLNQTREELEKDEQWIKRETHQAG
jgi:uncharacterized membrane protein YqjE